MHVCTKCKQTKTIEEMSKDASRRLGISSWCKSCRVTSLRTWKSKNTGRTRIKVAPEYSKARNYILTHRYKLSLDGYESLLKSQGYCCAICKRDATQMTYHLHVDHDHDTGEVRGLLCAPCNQYLGYIKDNPVTLNNALSYLQERKK